MQLTDFLGFLLVGHDAGGVVRGGTIMNGCVDDELVFGSAKGENLCVFCFS